MSRLTPAELWQTIERDRDAIRSDLLRSLPLHHSLVHKMGWNVAIEDGEVTWFRPLGRRYEPGPAPPDPPPDPERRKALMSEAAGYSGLEMWVRALAA